jgi:hypothetical protein
MTLPWPIARVLPVGLLRWYWRRRLQWQARQLSRQQIDCGAILLANHAQLDAALARTAQAHAKPAKG